MSVVKKAKYRIDNGTDFDVYHFETDAQQVTGKIVSLDDVDLVTEPGFLVDALAVKELNGKSGYADGYVYVDNMTLANSGSTYGYFTLPPGVKDWWISEAWMTGIVGGAESRYTLPHIDIKAWSNSIDIKIVDKRMLEILTTSNWSGSYRAHAVIAYKL